MDNKTQANGGLRSGMAFITIFVLLVILVVCWVTIRPAVEYARWRSRGDDAIRAIAERKPQGVPAGEWDIAAGWAKTAYGNVCFSADHVTQAELKKFVIDAEARFSSAPVDLDSIDWVWNRLSKTGPHGAQYCQKFEPIYRSEVALVQATRETPGASRESR